jgi:hypothetical protein
MLRSPVRLLITGLTTSSLLLLHTVMTPKKAASESPPTDRGQINGLLYQNIFADGTPGGPTTGITQSDAAIACRGVTTLQQSQSAKRCVNGLLYTRITDDARPAGPSTGMSTRNAAIACAIDTNPLPR